MKTLNILTCIVIANSLAAYNLYAQAKPGKSTPAPAAITIDASSFKSNSDPVKKESPPAPYRSTQQVNSEYEAAVGRLKEGKPSDSANLSPADREKFDTANALLTARLQDLKPDLLKWRAASEQIHKNKGLVPDFSTKDEIDDRIKQYQDLAATSKIIMDDIAEFADKLKEDNRARALTEAEINHLLAGANTQLTELKGRMAAAIELSGLGIKALEILKSQWGDWRYSTGRGMEFLPDFNAAEKQAYNQLVVAYKNKFEQLRATGGVE